MQRTACAEARGWSQSLQAGPMGEMAPPPVPSTGTVDEAKQEVGPWGEAFQSH